MSYETKVKPDVGDDFVPRCSEECPSYDGKRCKILGHRPDGICEPAVVVLARINERHDRELPEPTPLPDRSNAPQTLAEFRDWFATWLDNGPAYWAIGGREDEPPHLEADGDDVGEVLEALAVAVRRGDADDFILRVGPVSPPVTPLPEGARASVSDDAVFSPDEHSVHFEVSMVVDGDPAEFASRAHAWLAAVLYRAKDA